MQRLILLTVRELGMNPFQKLSVLFQTLKVTRGESGSQDQRFSQMRGHSFCLKPMLCSKSQVCVTGKRRMEGGGMA